MTHGFPLSAFGFPPMPSVLAQIADALAEALQLEVADEESTWFSEEFVARRTRLAQHRREDLRSSARVDVIPQVDLGSLANGTRAQRMHEYVIHVLVTKAVDQRLDEGDEGVDPDLLDDAADAVDLLAQEVQDFVDQLHPFDVDDEDPLAEVGYAGTSRASTFDGDLLRDKNIVRFLIECRYMGLR